jgi:O-antigen ligase
MSRPSLRGSFVAQAAGLCVVCWGALAFGCVYPWAYWPLAAGAAMVGAAGLIVSRSQRTRSVSRAFIWTLAAVAAAILTQLIPLPRQSLAALSPRAVDLLNELNPAFHAGLVSLHTLSVWPRDTVVAFILFGSFAVLLVGLAALFSTTGTRRFVEVLTIFGVVLALIGIVQKPLFTGAIYGLWPLDVGRQPFGPFVNRNHFAGWMVMALPLTLALLVAGIARSMSKVKTGWRHKVLWLSSPEASRLVLLGGAAGVMALSLMLTLSRSGITAFAVSMMITGWFAARALDDRSRRISAAVCLVLLLAAVVLWTGPAVIASRFASADWGEFNNRRGAWADAWSVVRDFPFTGTGLNTYWAASLFYQRHELSQFFAEAHNDYLQFAAEGGLLLIVPAVICLAFLVRDLRRAIRDQRGSTEWWLRAGAITSLFAIALQESVEFSLQMPGNAALLAVVCAIGLQRGPGGRDDHGDDQPQLPPRRAGRSLRLVASERRKQQTGELPR